jgi:hypothetical protein
MSFDPDFFRSVTRGPSTVVPRDQAVVGVAVGLAAAAAGAVYLYFRHVRVRSSLARRGGE